MAESSLSYSGALSVSEKGVKSASLPLSSTIKRQVQKFWQKSPDSWFANEPRGTDAFYRSLDEHSYKVHPRLQSAVDFEKTRGLRVLEIGCGCGSEAERFARAGDRPDNPLSQVFSRAPAQRMFWQFRNVKTEVMFWNPNWPSESCCPTRSRIWLASHWGWHLWIYAQKRHLEFTELKEIPYSEHFAVDGAPVLARCEIGIGSV